MTTIYAFLIVCIPIALLGVIFVSPFLVKTQECPKCAHKVRFVFYHAGKTCPACHTRLVIRNRKLHLV